MVWIAVARYDGNRQAPPIVDGLLCTEAVCVNRGRNELDEHAYKHAPVTVNAVFRPGVRLGQLAEVHDALQGISWRGKIVGIQYTNGGGAPIMVLDIEKPTINVAYTG